MANTTIASKLRREIPLPKMSAVSHYQLKYALLLSAVPLVCGFVLLMLLSVFSKLNLYFLESSGLILDMQVRDAYFKQVEIEIFSVIGYLLLQVFVTLIVSFTVMRWATAPFTGAQTIIQTALQKPEALKPASRFLSESPTFDRIIWLFALRAKSGGENQVKEKMIPFGTNLPFLAKFLVTFSVLSISTGYVLSIIMDSVYERIVDLAIHLVRQSVTHSHYFLAQQEMLQDANQLTTGLALLIYFVLGLNISRYMVTMLFVFSRAVSDDRFPITLRSTDLYQELAATMNQAREKIGN